MKMTFQLLFRILSVATLGILLGTGTDFALAQSYPNKPVRFIVPYPAGGGTDVVTRLITQQLAIRMGQPIIVENHGGAGGNIGGNLVALAAPDGYTILVGATPLTTNPSLYKNIPFDVLKDLAPVSLLMRQSFVLMAHPSVPANSLSELIALAKQKPKAFSFASHSAGGANHLAGELLNVRAGISLLHVPYKGAAPALTDLLGGVVSVMFENSSSMSYVQQGRLKALATSGPVRADLVANGSLPTMGETKGLEGFNVVAWFGILAPAKTPTAIINRLSSELQAVINLPEIKAKLNSMGFEIIGSPPKEFGDFMVAEVDKWAKVVAAAGVKID